MTKHSRKLIMVAALAAFLAAPALATAPSSDSATSIEAGWQAVLDMVEGWFSVVFGSDEGFPHVDPNGETFPHVDPNGAGFPHVDPNGDEACSSESCEGGFPHVDPNG